MKKRSIYILLLFGLLLWGCFEGTKNDDDDLQNITVLENISVTKEADKLIYYTGDNLDLTGLEVTGIYTDGSTKLEEITTENISGFDNTTTGTQTLTITLKGKTTNYEVLVKDPKLESILITKEPDKLKYYAGDSLDLNGLEVIGTYVTGTTKVQEIDESDVTGFDNQQLGTQTLTITLDEETATFVITVEEVILQSIEITSKPNKLTYYTGENLVIEGLEITGHYNNGDRKIGDITTDNISGFNNNQPETQILTITYQEETVTFNVEVVSYVSIFNFVEINNEIIIEKYIGGKEEIEIPREINEKIVTTIGVEAFFNTQVTRVEIPDSVTTISHEAFRDNKLTNIVIPSSVTAIGDGSFRGNQLTDIEIPNSITKLGNEAFYNNLLTNVKIPNSISKLSAWIFRENELISIEIPNSITYIGNHAFGSNELTSLTIPNSVITIDDWAFYGNQLTDIIIPNSVTTIGYEAFRNNKLTSIIIPNSVTTTGDGSFRGNELTNIEIPNSVTIIGDWGFRSNKLTNIEIPDSVTTIGVEAFYNNQLTIVEIPESVTTIGENAFSNNPNLIIKGVIGSEAQRYANENGIEFEDIQQEDQEIIE